MRAGAETEALVRASVDAARAERWLDCVATCRELLADVLPPRLRYEAGRRLMIALLRVAEADASNCRALLDEAISAGCELLTTVTTGSKEWAATHMYLAAAHVQVARRDGPSDAVLERVVAHSKLSLEVVDGDDGLRAAQETRIAYALMTITGGNVTSTTFRDNLLEARRYLLRAAKTYSAGNYPEESAETFRYLVEIDRRLKEFFDTSTNNER